MDEKRGIDWIGLPMITSVARLLCRELTLQNEYLREENRVLKNKAKGRLRFTDDERRSLMVAALAMGRALMKQVVTIVKPEIILAWQRRLEKEKWDYSARPRRQPGRPRTPADIEALVCRMARENVWGYQRIRGELLKLGIQRSKGGVADILRRNGLPPSPRRKGLSWRQFLARHAEVLLCLDLFTKEVWTCTGLRTAYVLFAIHLRTRRVVLAEATFSPNSQWMRQMGRNLLMECDDLGLAPRIVVHDRDELLVHELDITLGAAGVEIAQTPFRAPDANAVAERWAGSAASECLDHLILVGLGSLQRALDCYQGFCNRHRPHQGIGNRIPERLAAGEVIDLPPRSQGQRFAVGRVSFLGGLLNSYHRKAA